MVDSNDAAETTSYAETSLFGANCVQCLASYGRQVEVGCGCLGWKDISNVAFVTGLIDVSCTNSRPWRDFELPLQHQVGPLVRSLSDRCKAEQLAVLTPMPRSGTVDEVLQSSDIASQPQLLFGN